MSFSLIIDQAERQEPFQQIFNVNKKAFSSFTRLTRRDFPVERKTKTILTALMLIELELIDRTTTTMMMKDGPAHRQRFQLKTKENHRCFSSSFDNGLSVSLLSVFLRLHLLSDLRIVSSCKLNSRQVKTSQAFILFLLTILFCNILHCCSTGPTALCLRCSLLLLRLRLFRFSSFFFLSAPND